MNIVNWINVFFGDLRYSLRQFRRNPMFTTIAILSLGLGIGANTAIFSLMNAMLFRDLPVSDPHKLVMLTSPDDSGWLNGFAEKERDHISYPEFLQLREQLTTLSGLCAADSALRDWQVRIGDQQQEKVIGKFVSEEYFSVFGVEPAMGRLLNSQDAKGPGQDPYAVISYDFWQRRLGGQTNVLGMPIILNGATLTVIGVARQGFKGESVAQNPDLWVPMMMQPSIYPGRDWLHEDSSQSLQKVMWLNAFGRLESGANLNKVQAEVDVVFSGMMQAFYPSTLAPDIREKAFNQYLVVREARAGTFPGRDDIASQLKILLAVTGLVLLIACANVANLLLVRATGRQREMSVRFALGASRLRVFQQLFTESLLLSLLGGVAGLLIALSASRILLSLISDPRQPFDLPGAPDWRVLGFTAGVALVTSALFGLAPAWRATRTDINSSLRESSRSVTYSGRRMNLAKLMVIGQVAVSFLLIVGAGLLVRTLWNLQAISLGFPKERLVQVKLDGLVAGYKDQALLNFYASLADRLSQVPGVRGVAYSDLGLLTGSEGRCRVQIDGVTPEREEDRRSNYDFISPGYFDVLEVPLIMGREIGPQDTAASQKVCVINEELASRLSPGQNPIGRRLTALDGKTSNTLEIVGVAKNLRSYSLRNKIPPRFYAPVRQGYFDQEVGPIVFQIRTASDPETVLSTVRKAIFDDNPNVPITFASTIENLIADRTMSETQIARLCSIFGLLALQLAAVGLYSVISQGIARRTNEIGIRMALGASPGKVIRMVLGETGFLAAIGLAAGVVAAGMATQVIASKLFGLGRMDPLTIAVALALVSVVALVAGYIPAARAARVSPVEALRHE